MNSLFITGSSRFSRVKASTAEKQVSSLPMMFSPFNADDYSRSMESSGAVYRTASQQPTYRNDHYLFARWIGLLKQKVALTPSMMNMLRSFVTKSMPYHLAAKLATKIALLGLNCRKASQMSIVRILFERVMEYPPLYYEQFHRQIRNFAMTFLAVKVISPESVARMQQYMLEVLPEIRCEQLPMLMRYLGTLGLRFQNFSDELVTALLHQILRFSDFYDSPKICLLVDGLGQMRFEFPSADPYVQNNLMGLINRALQDWALENPYHTSNLRSLFLGIKTCNVTHSVLSEEVKQSLVKFIDEKVPLMSLVDQTNVLKR